nr:hypothetical protein [Roseomonas ponticola]
MLRPQRHHIASPLARVEQQRQRQARQRADRIGGLESLDLRHGPGVEAIRIRAGQVGHAGRWVIGHEPGLDAMPEGGPQGFQQTIRGFRRVGAGIAYLHQVAGFQARGRLVAMRHPEPVEDAAAHPLGPLIHRAEGRASVVGDHQGIDTAGCDRPHGRLRRHRLRVDGAAILSLESIGARRLVKPHLGLAGQAQIGAHVAVPVLVLDREFPAAGAFDHPASSHGLAPLAQPVAAFRSSTHASKSKRSHPFTPRVTATGIGMRPAATSASKVETPKPR